MVAFQIRNPLYRGHEELTKRAGRQVTRSRGRWRCASRGPSASRCFVDAVVTLGGGDARCIVSSARSCARDHTGRSE